MNTNKISIKNSLLMPEIAQLIAEGHTVTLPLKGNSMRPYLVHMRDKALLEKPSALKVGDVVLAEVSPKHYVLHRIIKIVPDGDVLIITLRGDGNFSTESCRSTDVLAVATAFYRKGRTTADSVYTRKYRLYSCIWMNTFPLRRYFLKLHDIFFHSLKDLSK